MNDDNYFWKLAQKCLLVDKPAGFVEDVERVDELWLCGLAQVGPPPTQHVFFLFLFPFLFLNFSEEFFSSPFLLPKKTQS